MATRDVPPDEISYDSAGLPIVPDRRPHQVAAICPICLDTKAAYFSATKKSTLFFKCGSCFTAMFINSRSASLLVKRWQRMLNDDGVREMLADLLVKTKSVEEEDTAKR